MNKANNIRFQRTERRIQDFVLGFLEENPDARLTVSDICDGLSINRSSFYIHHKDLQSVLDAVQIRLHREHMEQLKEEDVLSSPAPISAAFRLFFLHVADHYSFYRYYVKNTENPGLIGQHWREATSCLMSLKPSFFELSEVQLSYLGEFIQAGVFAVIQRWLSGSREDSIEEVTELFDIIMKPLDSCWKQ
ncbi:MAG: TetR/AcrR family transcriptional regulator [Oscillospiraceae bacterium]|nr:TetR/AcrR family transcriptional regulator [Oscillospiraceae bacterium]